VPEHRLSLAVNGREHQLHTKLVAFEMPDSRPGDGDGTSNGHAAATWSVAIVGLGYVGLPTALALHGQCPRIIGIDVSQPRLQEISERRADLGDPDRLRLDAALADSTFELTSDPATMAEADAVIVCVPTPVDADYVPDLAALSGACASVVAHARPGQTIILTSTTYAGTTRELLAEPLEKRGLRVGTDVFVAFSPERIDPGNPDHLQRETPRVVGGVTRECANRAAWVIGQLTDAVYLVSSPEAAEATKLYENIFRAVSLALANEFADACGTLGLDPIEITLAAGTKPYGFLGAFPGPGVGGHCIPCDPHYLLWQLNKQDRRSPLIEQAMKSISLRPARVVERAGEVLAAAGRSLAGARVIVVGVSYKAGVQDLRESPAIPLIAGLIRAGADVGYYDPLLPQITLPGGQLIRTQNGPGDTTWDLAVIHTIHPGVDYSWVPNCPHVLDATYQFDTAPQRAVV
jgi:UDP-N-acetyl-D-glucosamine dehydrogenase